MLKAITPVAILRICIRIPLVVIFRFQKRTTAGFCQIVLQHRAGPALSNTQTNTLRRRTAARPYRTTAETVGQTFFAPGSRTLTSYAARKIELLPLRPPTQALITLAARCGYIAKGTVYILIGWLAILTTLDMGGQRGGTTRAVRELASQPFGGVLLVLLAIGLCGYTGWRLVQAIFDAEHKGHNVKGIAVRFGYVLSGAIYAGIAVNCIELLLDAGNVSSSTSSHARTLMQQPGGILLLLAVGLGCLAVGLRQMWRGWQRSYEKNWHLNQMSHRQRRLADIISRIGLTARGLVFVIIAAFLCLAALQTDPDEARGLGGALRILAEQPFGRWLLMAVALGLIAYGGYCMVNARFRNVDAR